MLRINFRQPEDIWKPIRIIKNGEYYDLSDRYEVSHLGKVRNKNTGRILKPCINTTGYYEAKLRKKDQRKICNFKVHRLVANAFIPNPDNLPQVNHIDGNPLNPKASNLEWCTQSQNMKHAYDSHLIDHDFLRHQQQRCTDKNSVRVNQYTLDGKYIKTYKSYMDAGNAVGVSDVAIRKCSLGKTKHSAGYKWKRVNDDKLYITCQNLLVKL